MATNFVSAQVEKTYRSVTPAVHQVKASVMDGLLRLYEYAKLFAIGGVIAYLVVMRVDYAIALAIPAGFMCKWMSDTIMEFYTNVRSRYGARKVQSESYALDAKHKLLVDEQVDRHSQPQSVMNQLANYVPCVDDSEVEPFEDEFTDIARQVILDFTVKIYEEGLIDKNGFIDNQSVTVPWSQRGIRRFDPDLRKLMGQLISDLSRKDGLYEFVDKKKQWRVRTDIYLTIEDALLFIDRMPSGIFTEGQKVML